MTPRGCVSGEYLGDESVEIDSELSGLVFQGGSQVALNTDRHCLGFPFGTNEDLAQSVETLAGWYIGQVSVHKERK